MRLHCSILLGLACLGQDQPPEIGPARRRAIAERESWTKKSVEEWMTMLDTSDAATRRARVGIFSGMGGTDYNHLRPAFLRALGDPDPGVRLAAAVAIMNNQGYSEAEDARTTEVLGQALVGPDPRARSEAVSALYSSPERTMPALPRLARVMNLLEDDSGDWRYTTEIFERLGAGAAPAVGELVVSLKSGGTRAKARAATLLASIGEPAKVAVPALLLTIRYADRDVAFASYDAIRRIDPESQPHPSPVAPFIPAEVATLEGPDLLAGLDAVDRLSKAGPEAIDRIPAILQFIVRSEKRSVGMDWSLVYLVGRLSRDRFGDKLMPALLDQVRDDRPEAAELVCTIIGNGRVGNADSIPALMEKLDQTGGRVRGAVAFALGSITRADPRGIPPLVRALKDPDAQVRLGAAKGLQCLEKATPEAIAAAEAATDDPDPRVRIAARGALTFLRMRQPPK